MGSVTVVSMCSVFVIVIFLTTFTDAGFLENFCAVNCNRGLGGNLCRCNGFHFAGKRTLANNYFKSKDDLFSLSKDELTPSDLDLSTLENELRDGGLREGRMRKGDMREGSPVGDQRRENQAKEFLEWLLLKLKQREENRSGYGAFRDMNEDLTN